MTRKSSLPPDRGHVQTEFRNPSSLDLDVLDISSFVGLMVEDHRQVVQAVAGAADSLGSFIAALAPRMRRGGRLIYIGAGTSGRLGVLDASECPPTFQVEPTQVVGIIAGGDRSLRRSSEGMEDDPNGAAPDLHELKLNENDSVVGIAAGGTTPYVLGAIRLAKEQARASTALITCAPLRSQPAGCDHIIVLNTGPELLTGSTRLKAGSATKLALNIISTGVFVQLGKVYTNLMVDLRATNDKLRDRAIRILLEFDPGLSRDKADKLLRNANDQVKLAIVMHQHNATQQAAAQRLHTAQGDLRRALET